MADKKAKDFVFGVFFTLPRHRGTPLIELGFKHV